MDQVGLTCAQWTLADLHVDLKFTPGKREGVLEHHISRASRVAKKMADGLPEHQWKSAMILGSGFQNDPGVCHWVILALGKG